MKEQTVPSRLVTKGHRCDLCDARMTPSDIERGWADTSFGLLLFCSACISTVSLVDTPGVGVLITGLSVEQRLARIERRLEIT